VGAEFDESDFIDTDYQQLRKAAVAGVVPSASAVPGSATSLGSAPGVTPVRPPTPEELDAKVHATQQRLEDLKRLQEQLEQERTALEEARRRRTEYTTGREEMIAHLTRGLGLLEESEFKSRRDAEQAARAVSDLRDHLVRVQNLNDQLWTEETYAVELTRALTALENARLEWSACQLKFPVLTEAGRSAAAQAPSEPSPMEALAGMSLGTLCRLGLALTWPIALAVLAAAAAFLVALWRQ
jgi:DNA repair exonuclease SbcCD ATPase subunit